jgi:hypothetical protein
LEFLRSISALSFPSSGRALFPRLYGHAIDVPARYNVFEDELQTVIAKAALKNRIRVLLEKSQEIIAADHQPGQPHRSFFASLQPSLVHPLLYGMRPYVQERRKHVLGPTVLAGLGVDPKPPEHARDGIARPLEFARHDG